MPILAENYHFGLLHIPKDTHYFSGSESKLIFACASGFKDENQELGCLVVEYLSLRLRSF